MNISFYDGINDGKFFNISAGKYDDLDDIDDINVDDIDISTDVEEEDTDLPCADCECPGLEEVKNEISTHLAMINKVNMRLNQLGNKISDLKEFRDETYELQYGQLLDRLNLIEKKIDAFKCFDILDKVSHLYERLEKVEPKLEKLERNLTSNGMLIADFGRHINNTDCELSSLSDRVSNLDSKLAVTAKIVEAVKDKACIVDTINGTISGYDYAIMSDKINELESKLEKLNPVEPIKPCENMENPTSTYYDNELKYFTTPGCAKGEIHDSVNHPSHYTDGKYECIDFIEEYGMVTHIGNAIKYISRNGKKDTSKFAEDLNKAFWYLHRYNTPQSMGHINAIDYCHEKKLPIELAGVIIDISHGEYKHAEELLGDYITKITGKTPKALEDEQSK